MVERGRVCTGTMYLCVQDTFDTALVLSGS